MAGLTPEGFEIKRLPKVIQDLRLEAIPIFQDLLEDPNDFVDTSEDSTIGRFIGLLSPALADLWEASQEVYSAFDPNSATGIALDNIVAIGGITREGDRHTTAEVYLFGDIGTTIPVGSLVRSPSNSALYETQQTVELTPDASFGVGVVVSSLEPETNYRLFYRPSDAVNYNEVVVVSATIPTEESILDGFVNKISANHPDITARREGQLLIVDGSSDFQLTSFYSSFNMSVSKSSAVATVVAVDAGPIEQLPGTIDSIATPILGWDSVTNPVTASTGSYRESDEELRVRFRDSKFQRATNIIEALYSSLINTAGVEQVVIFENDTDEVDENGLPPHSFWTIVVGGVDTDIARAIWLNRPTGIRSQGSTSVDIVDSFGYVRTINFSRPRSVEFYVRLNITTNPQFPPQGEDLIKTRLHEFVDRLSINQDVVYSRLYTPINSVQGHQVESLEVSLDGENWFSSNIEVGLDEKALLPITNIQIN